MGTIHTVGPNEALVISGGCFGTKSVRTVIGGWGWAWWLVTQVQKLSLQIISLNPECKEVETSEGVPLTVTGVAQVKVNTDDDVLNIACEQFLGKSTKDMEKTILHTLEGHLRAILGTLSVEEIYRDRDQFATLVREMAAPDVKRMGITILSFTIKDVFDNVEYLNSLGRAQTANVKRDADIGVAEAERDAGIRFGRKRLFLIVNDGRTIGMMMIKVHLNGAEEAECEQARMGVRYEADSIIAQSRCGFETQNALFRSEICRSKAEAELAYELQAAKVQQSIRAEEMEIDVMEKRKLIEIEEKEVVRNEKDLEASVKRPAEAEAFQMEVIAEGKRVQKLLHAQAASEAIKLCGQAEADALAAVGKAEAEGMRLRAQAYKRYGDAAMLQLVLDSLPKVAAEVAAPLGRTGEIVMLSGEDRVTTEVSRLLGGLTPAVHALTGVDLTKALKSSLPTTSSASASA